jgi:hypothetical protein
MLERRFSPLIAIAVLVAVGCGATADDATDSEALGETGTDEAGLRGTVYFDTFTDSIGSAGQSETRKVFTSAAAYRNYFGHNPPSAVDFYTDWVAFYSAGDQSTGGYDASIESIETSSSGATIYLKTRLESPGANCFVTQSTTKPYTLVRFHKPWPRPRYVRTSKHDDTLWCDDPDPTCDTLDCGTGTHCDDTNGPAACVADACPGSGRRSATSHECECNVLGICPLGSWWNDDPSVCGCE